MKNLVELCKCDIRVRLAYLKKKCEECNNKKYDVEYIVESSDFKDERTNERIFKIANDSITEFLLDDNNFKNIFIDINELIIND